MSKRDKEIIKFIQKYDGGETDNYGQIVIYTGMMYDENGNIVPFKNPEDE